MGGGTVSEHEAEPVAAIEGTVAPGFEQVRKAFERNFAEHGDVGASVGVYVRGEPVVDLWGGTADVDAGTPWSRDTLALVYSVTKGPTATLANLLAERGELDLDRPVAGYWPEFAAAGKERITTRQVLSHQAGLPVIDARLNREELFEGKAPVAALAAQAPVWEPGSRHGYHALTFGWLIGEIVLRATGRPLGEALAEFVAGPLGIDLFVGCPVAAHVRIARQVDPPPPAPGAIEAIEDPARREHVERIVGAMMDPESLLARALTSNSVLPLPNAEAWGEPRVYSAEQPAVGGITNGRSLAKMYGSLVAEVDGVRLLDEASLARAVAPQSEGQDEVLLAESRFGSGYMLPSSVAPMLSASSFGHTGAGGAHAFADPDAGVGFGYAQNQLGSGIAGQPRIEGLIEALRESLDGAR
jgi:CubicO group peptidase (beta-lactamase class C family)